MLTVYIDDMYRSTIGRLGRMSMSHMMADTRNELLAMADRIGMRRAWLQHPDAGRDRAHFDVSLERRKRAIAFGAIPVTRRDLVRIIHRWRKDDRSTIPRHDQRSL